MDTRSVVPFQEEDVRARMTGRVERIVIDRPYGKNFLVVYADKIHQEWYGFYCTFQFWSMPVGLLAIKVGDHVEVALNEAGQPLGVKKIGSL